MKKRMKWENSSEDKTFRLICRGCRIKAAASLT